MKFQESTTILNAWTKIVWKLIECTIYIYIYEMHVCVCAWDKDNKKKKKSDQLLTVNIHKYMVLGCSES